MQETIRENQHVLDLLGREEKADLKDSTDDEIVERLIALMPESIEKSKLA